jgi:hypothetical protein
MNDILCFSRDAQCHGTLFANVVATLVRGVQGTSTTPTALSAKKKKHGRRQQGSKTSFLRTFSLTVHLLRVRTLLFDIIFSPKDLARALRDDFGAKNSDSIPKH